MGIATAAASLVHRVEPRLLVIEVVACFRERHLVQHASAIAFHVLVATVPLALFALAMLGFLGLAETWSIEWELKVALVMAPDTFSVVDRTVESLLTGRRTVWLTTGLLLTLWQVGAVVRSSARALNALYDLDEDRSWPRRVVVSLGAAAVILPGVVAAVAVALVGDEVAGPVLGLLRWLIVVGLLLGVTWMVLRVAPAARPPMRYVSLGTALVVAGWIGASLAYAAYVTGPAAYGSLFGALAAVVVLMTYVWLLAIVFLAGAAIDAALRRRT